MNTTLQFLDLATMEIVAVSDCEPGVEPVEGDEIELVAIGEFKVVRRRWSFGGESKAVIILMLERLS